MCPPAPCPSPRKATKWSAITGCRALAIPPDSKSRRTSAAAPRNAPSGVSERKKVATQKVPIVFEPRVARSLLGDIFDAINGDAIYRHQSFLTGKLGEKIASEKVTVIDDGTIPGLFGTSPFDDEGVPSRRTVVIERGVLKNYLLNTYTARKLGMKTTGNAARGITGNPGISHGNFYLEAGDRTSAEIIAAIPQGFYVTELIGSGVNVVTGDYSRGAVGVWIENGELTYPVAEVTIAGTLQEMLMGIVADRVGPGVSRFHRIAYNYDRGDDGQWSVNPPRNGRISSFR